MALRRAYVSATYDDLGEYRGIVGIALRNFGYVDVSMEYYFAEERRPIEGGLVDLAESDLYVAIIAWRYGYVPKNPGGISITELEYEKAVELGKPRLIFMVAPEVPWKASLVDKDVRKINAFRARVLQNNAVSFFTSLRTLQDAVERALANLDDVNRALRRPTPPPPQTVALIRSLSESPERIARLLASIVLADRSRLALLESPTTAAVADALSSNNAQNADGVAALIGRMDGEPFEPDPLWLAWITHIHRDRLTEIGAEILRVSDLATTE